MRGKINERIQAATSDALIAVKIRSPSLMSRRKAAEEINRRTTSGYWPVSNRLRASSAALNGEAPR